jgi:hypothetical protein
MKKILTIELVGILILSGFGAYAIPISNPFIQQSLILDEYDMVIIAPEFFSESLQKLIEHKNSLGIRTFLKRVEEIYDEYQGYDDAEQIKYFIKDAIESYGIEYVLLVGGRKGQSLKWYIPVRYINNKYHVADSDFYHKKFISDLYFADIYKQNDEFEDWDSDSDGIFAEWNDDGGPDDSLDLIPDVYLGRLPCRYKNEVSIIVDKIIRYENTVYGQEWLNDILLVGGDSFPGIGEPFPYEGEVSCEWILNYLEGFNPTRLYCSYGTLTGSNDFISAFNKGNGFVLYHGHGKQNSLHTYHPDSRDVINVFNPNSLNRIHNEDRLPVMVVGCCLTTDFDVGILNFLNILKNYNKYVNFFDFIEGCVSECLGWNMVKKSDGGSIAYIGGTSTGYLVPGDNNHDDIPDVAQMGYTTGLCDEFFRVYGIDSKRILGEIYCDTLASIIKNQSAQTNRGQCKCVQEFLLIGDPSLKIGGYP